MTPKNLKTGEKITTPSAIISITQQELIETIDSAKQEGLSVCQESVNDVHDFIREKLPRVGIKPSYADIHPDGKIALMWQIQGKAIAGMAFEGKRQIIWNYYQHVTDKKESSTFHFDDFLASNLYAFLKGNL